MHQRHRAKFRAALERGEHLVIIHHQRAFIGHEVLEGGDALLHHFRHILADLIVPIGDAHMVGIIGRSLR